MKNRRELGWNGLHSGFVQSADDLPNNVCSGSNGYRPPPQRVFLNQGDAVMFCRCRNLAWVVLSFVLAFQSVADDEKKSADKKADEKKADSIETILNIDVSGRPDMVARDGTKMYIWRDDTGWHLRTNAKNNKKKKKGEKFGGVIQVQEGRITSLQSTTGLESKKKGRDAGWLSPEKKTIRFEFQTTGKGEDGFDFQVTDSAKAIRFDLRIGGYDHPDQILLGFDKQPAPAGVFVLGVPSKKAVP